MKIRFILILSLTSTFLWATKKFPEGLIQHVNTYVGTAAAVTDNAGKHGKHTEEFGQTLPAVLVPNGTNFMTAQTQSSEKKCLAPYYYKDSLFQGFRNSHWIVGGCTQDYGSMTIMPLLDCMNFQPETRASRFGHKNEVSTPAYYSVFLDDYQIKAEMTATTRCAIFQYTFLKAGMAYIAVNPNSDEGLGNISVNAKNGIVSGSNPVHRIYQGWGKPAGFSGHFYVKIDNKRIETYGVFQNEKNFDLQNSIANQHNIGAYVGFKVNAGETVVVRMGSSFTSIENAALNLRKEIPTPDFDKTKRNLETIWEKTLSAVTVETDNLAAKRKFYTAMYHAHFLPRIMNDASGAYPAFSKGNTVYTRKGCDYYDDFSMWDTYRALHPLINILNPSKSGDMMQSLTDKYVQGGWMPIFPCWNSYTAAMIGDHCSSVIADAYIKGIRNFDVENAYEGLRKNAFTSPDNFEDYENGMGRRALKSYLKYGYIPLEDSVKEAFHTNEQVSRTLEYAFDDFTLSQLAKALEKTNDAAVLRKRSENYQNVIDPQTGYARGRFANSDFVPNFNPYNFAWFITEGYPVHYSWYVPQDIPGLMAKMGGEQRFCLKLDSMFTQNRYWHGNEPGHQIPFLFNYTTDVWRTQQYVPLILEAEYKDLPGGLSGNDDAGQMSAWYIFAALGFYPVTPGTPYYLISVPTFKQATLNLHNNKKFTIITVNLSQANKYIQSATLNGKVYTKNYISHKDILEGGEMVFTLGNNPSNWGIGQYPPVE